MTEDIVVRLHKMAKCIYLAVEKSVADELSAGMCEAADELKRLEAALSTCRELREYDRAEIERLKIERAEFETLMAARLKAATERMENMRAILLEKRQ